MERVYRVWWHGDCSREYLGRYFAESGAEACARARRENGIDEGDGHVVWQLVNVDQVWAGGES